MINPVLKLQTELKKLKEFSIKHKNEFTNEEITKQMLILPFLKILGYDIKDPMIIKAEYSPSNVSNSYKVDYCAITNGTPSIFIEAKSFGRNLYRYVDQLAMYFDGSANGEVGILTNGTDYLFYTKDSNSDFMNRKPFFIFSLLEYSIHDLELLTTFIYQTYNYREMRLTARESRVTNEIRNFLYDLVSNPDAMIEILGDIGEELNKDSLNRIIPVAIERAIISKGEEFEIERDKQAVLKYSEQQLLSLGHYNHIDAISHSIFIPNKDKFDSLVRASEEEYSVEKGNPLSDFFITKVYRDGKNIKGYLIGHYQDSFDDNGERDISLYCSPIDNIAKFVHDNPVVMESGFINARLQSRTNNKTGKVSYYLQSNISGISFQNFPSLLHELNEFEDFYKEFFV